MFRATQCSSSGESIVSIHHLVYISLCRWSSVMQCVKLVINTNIYKLFTKQGISTMKKFSMEGHFGVAGYQQIWHRENKRHNTNDKCFKEYSNRRILIGALAFCYISTTRRNKTSHFNICNSLITWHVFRKINSEFPSVLRGVDTHTHVCMYIYIYVCVCIYIYPSLYMRILLFGL
jgi:hypothetical protein